MTDRESLRDKRGLPQIIIIKSDNKDKEVPNEVTIYTSPKQHKNEIEKDPPKQRKRPINYILVASSIAFLLVTGSFSTQTSILYPIFDYNTFGNLGQLNYFFSQITFAFSFIFIDTLVQR